MPSLSDADGPASVDSGPSTDLWQILAQKINALQESVATQSATITSQGALIDVLTAAAEASKHETETLKAAAEASKHETETLKAAMKTSEQAFQAAAKTSEQNTETLKATVETLKARAPRNLVICIDGTSNQFGTKNTNVVELYHRLIRDETQLTFYNSGIGTYATPSWKSWRYWRMIIYNKIDLAIAWNFEGIIISAYRWLSENYEPGDKIFVFGFSRGAYQIRALAAMIHIVGLLRKGNLDQIPFAYELYAETKTTEPWGIMSIIGLALGDAWTVIIVLSGWGRSAFYLVTRRTPPAPQPKDKQKEIPLGYELHAETQSIGPWTMVWMIGLAFGYVRTVVRLVRLVLPNASDRLVVLVILLGWIPLAYYVITGCARQASELDKEQAETKEMCRHFKETFSQKDVEIEFAGAWDTVSSVGLIRDKTLPGTMDGMKHVKHFRHALALHERRVKFLNENSRGGQGPTEEATGYVQDREAVEIEFAGAWDTVSSVGLIRDKTLPGTMDGMKHVKHFRDALAPHERRVKFLNENVRGGQGPTKEATGHVRDREVRRSRTSDRPHTKEVWFAGSHGDIGGGAVFNPEMNMFGPSLRWMLYEAAAAGLRISSAPETEKDMEVHNSLTWPWVILEYLPITRLTYKDRDGLTSWPHRGQPRQIQANQLIHSTALTSHVDWRTHLPSEEGMEWNDTTLRARCMIEEDQYTDTRDLIARLSTLPPGDDDLDALKELIQRGDGKAPLRSTIGAETTLLDLLQFRADHNILMTTDVLQTRWQSVAAAASIVLNFDAAEGNQVNGELFGINHLVVLVDRAKDEAPLPHRLKRLLAQVLINTLREIFGSSTDIIEKDTLRALEIVSKTDDWKHIQAIPDAETEFIALLQRFSAENDPSGRRRQVIADVVLQLNQHEADWKDKYYLSQELRPILARARGRNDLELLQRFEKRYAPGHVQSPFQHPNVVNSVAWMPDGARVVSGCDDNAVRIWNVKTASAKRASAHESHES